MENNIEITYEKKGSYLITSEGKDISIEIPDVKIPFGIEDYNKKKIVNIEFTGMELDNKVHNFYSQIIGFENLFQKEICNLDQCQIDQSDEFVSCIKKNGKFTPMVRVNILDESLIPLKGCKKNSCVNGKIILKKVWKWREKWGLFFELTELNVKTELQTSI